MIVKSGAAVHSFSSVEDRSSWRTSFAIFILLLVVVWAVLDALYVSFPLVRPGAEIVSNAKFDIIAKEPMFPAATRNRVLIFGDSRVMAGFLPAAFDEAFGPDTRSFNMALPGEPHFLPILEATLAAGNIPNYVLLTTPWDNVATAPTLFAKLSDDSGIADTLFPFRFLPRDVVLFAFNSRMHLLHEYQAAALERDKAVVDRGWYFIKSQNHYPDGRLPDGFSLASDQPQTIRHRILPAHSLVRDRLAQLAERYHFTVFFIPLITRHGELAPWKTTAEGASDRLRIEQITDQPAMHVIGPDYWIYPSNDFSDPRHLNRTGALAFTADLASLLKQSGIIP